MIIPKQDYDSLTTAEVNWIQDGAAGIVVLAEVSVLSGTASGKGVIYAKSSDSKLYYQDDSGAETDLTATGNPGGSNTQVQFNDSSSCGGSGSFSFNKTTGVVTATAFVTNTGSAYSVGASFNGPLDDIAVLTQSASAYIASNGTDFISRSVANVRGDLGLIIGTNVQAFDTQLSDIAGLTPSASAFIGSNASNLLLRSAAETRGDLGLIIGTNAQAWDNDLDDLAALTHTASAFIVSNGTDWLSRSLASTKNDLALGTIASQNANNVSITGGSVTGITDLVVADGGTGNSIATAYTVLCGGNTSTSPFNSVVGLGSSSQVLTSNGAGLLPTWQAASVGTSPTATIQALVFEKGTNVVSGNGKFFIHADSRLNGLKLVEAHARHITTAPAGSSSKINITNTGQSGTAAAGTAMLSTSLFIQPTQLRSDQASTSYVISSTGSAVLLYDLLRVDIVEAGTTGSARGLIVTLGFK